MFAYIIIGIELIVLYLVFWIVFIREPKPREIRAELWGRYADSNDETAFANNQSPRIQYLFIDQKKLNSYLPSKVKVRAVKISKIRKKRHRSGAGQHACSCSCACHDQGSGQRNSGWSIAAMRNSRQEEPNREMSEKFLLLLNRTLNKFSVKVP